ncbi:MAG: hypothetical protein AAF639_05490, partial [Chloroflexota bacterium]
ERTARMINVVATRKLPIWRPGGGWSAPKPTRSPIWESVRSELGGLSKSLGYALENEAYRVLPAFLEKEYGITVTERFI